MLLDKEMTLKCIHYEKLGQNSLIVKIDEWIKKKKKKIKRNIGMYPLCKVGSDFF